MGRSNRNSFFDFIFISFTLDWITASGTRGAVAVAVDDTKGNAMGMCSKFVLILWFKSMGALEVGMIVVVVVGGAWWNDEDVDDRGASCETRGNGIDDNNGEGVSGAVVRESVWARKSDAAAIDVDGDGDDNVDVDKHIGWSCDNVDAEGDDDDDDNVGIIVPLLAKDFGATTVCWRLLATGGDELAANAAVDDDVAFGRIRPFEELGNTADNGVDDVSTPLTLRGRLFNS